MFPQKAGEITAQLKGLYTNRRSRKPPSSSKTMTYVPPITVISPPCDNMDSQSAALDGYKLFRRNRQGRRGDRVAPYGRECFGCLGCNDDTAV